jgi:hypothetical protein
MAMGSKSLQDAFCVLLFTVGFISTANAAVVTHGYLSSDDATDLIVDSLNSVEYLRLDVLADLTYAETLAVLDTQSGGGWSIATLDDALGFTASLLGGTSVCAHNGVSVTTTLCGTLSSWDDGDLGANFD